MTTVTEAEAKPWFCYILATEDDSATYVGATIDPDRRLRQHNKELAGGARATGARVGAGHTWRRLCRISGFPDKHAALQFEWRLKSLGRRKELARLTPLARRVRCLRDLMALDRPTKFAEPFVTYEGGGPQIHWECVIAETEFTRIGLPAASLSPPVDIPQDICPTDN
jgi:predicted GIY-YIG superfamily endonuclease